MGIEVVTQNRPIVGKPVTHATKIVTQDSRRGWVEYNKAGKWRYPRRRWWLRRNGKWVKNKTPPRVPNYGPFSEEQYRAIKAKDQRIKEAEYRD